MKKPLAKLFLYRHRFVIGYVLLALAFTSLVFFLPLVSPEGLSEAEMASAVDSYHLSFSSLQDGSLVDLPYHALQKLSITIFGLTPYSIKLPSIIIGIALGFLLILLLNRWFKNNVALLASIITVLSTPFLYLAGSGTPLIMLVLWPVLLLWLGSKIQGNKKPKPIYSLAFAIILLASVFTPYMPYLDLFIVIFAVAHPHLRFTIKSLPRIPFIITTLVVLAGLGVFGYSLITHPTDFAALLLARGFEFKDIIPNLGTALSTLFSWNGQVEGLYLAPLVSLATVFLALIGLISTAKGFFASRNAIASIFIVATLVLSALSPDNALLIILPLAILTAHGLRYILQKWYGLFPENPYARVAGLIPITIFIATILSADLFHYVLGYRYNPVVTANFNTDLSLVSNLPEDTPLFLPTTDSRYPFFAILNDKSTSTPVISEYSYALQSFATLGRAPSYPSGYRISRIITSPKSDNSDRIYIYSLNRGE